MQVILLHKLTALDKLMYPQYERYFKLAHAEAIFGITESIWEEMRRKARAELEAEYNPPPVVPDIRRHWFMIANGTVPFGVIVVVDGVDYGDVTIIQEGMGENETV